MLVKALQAPQKEVSTSIQWEPLYIVRTALAHISVPIREVSSFQELLSIYTNVAFGTAVRAGPDSNCNS